MQLSRAKPGNPASNLYRKVCVRACVRVSFQAYTRRRLWSDRDQIWHAHADSPRKGSVQNKILPRVTQGELGGGGFRGSEIENVGNLPNGWTD